MAVIAAAAVARAAVVAEATTATTFVFAVLVGVVYLSCCCCCWGNHGFDSAGVCSSYVSALKAVCITYFYFFELATSAYVSSLVHFILSLPFVLSDVTLPRTLRNHRQH